jgi:hypothetical protein
MAGNAIRKITARPASGLIVQGVVFQAFCYHRPLTADSAVVMSVYNYIAKKAKQ